MLIKKFIYGIFCSCIGLATFGATFALVIDVPPQQGQQDVIVTWPTQIQSDEGTLFSTIQLINQYLRFAIGVICMGVLVYGGINLVTAQWDEAKTKKASGLLTWALIGILIAILSYAAVRLIVNLLT